MSVGALQVEVYPDTSKFNQRLIAAMNGQGESLDIPVGADTKNAENAINMWRESQLKNIKADVDANTKAAEAKIAAIQAKMKNSSASINLDADTALASAKLQKLAGEIKGKVATINANADTAAATAKLAVLSRTRHVSVIVNAVGGEKIAGMLAAFSGARLATDYVTKLKDSVLNLDRSLPSIATRAVGFTVLGAGAIAAAGHVITLAGGLTQVLGVGVALPGVLTGMAVGAVVMGVALADAKNQLSSLAPAFSNLKSIIQGNFWEAAKAPIEQMANTLMPQLEQGVSKVSTSLGQWTGAFASAFQQALGGTVLVTMFDNLATSIDIAKNGATPFAQSIATLGTIGSSYLPQLAQWFTDITARFNEFIQVSAGNGQLVTWIENGKAALASLGAIIVNLGGIFSGLFTAISAAGGASLASLASGLGLINEAVNQPAFQGQLTTFFAGAIQGSNAAASGIGTLGSALMSISGTLSSVMVTAGNTFRIALEGIAQAIQNPVFQTGLTDFFNGVQTGVQAIAPQLPTLAGLFGQLMSVAGTLAATIGPVLGNAITQLAPSFSQILSAIEPLIPMLGESLISAINAVVPVFQMIADNANTIVPALAGLGAGFSALSAVVGFVSPIVDVLSKAFQLLKPVLNPIIAGMQGLVTAFMGLSAPVMAVVAVIAVLVAGFIYLWNTNEGFRNAIINAWNTIVSTITSVVTTIVTAVVDGWNNMVNGVSNAMSTIGNAISSVWNGIVSFITGVMATIGSAISDGWNGLTIIVSSAVNGIISAATAGWNVLVSVVSAVMTGIVTVVTVAWQLITIAIQLALTIISAVITAGWNILVIIITAAMNIITTLITAGWNLIAPVVTTVMTIITSVISAAWNMIVTIITSVMTAIITAATVGWNLIVTVVTTVMAVVTAVITAVWNGISTIISAAMTLIIAAATTGWNMIVTVVTTVMTAVITVVTTIWNAIVAVVSAVCATISSVVAAGWNVIVSVVSSVCSTIMNVVSSIWNAIVSIVSSVMSTIMSVISSVWNSIVSVVSSVMSTISSVISSVWNAISSVISSVLSSIVSFVSSAFSSIVNFVNTHMSAVKSVVTTIINAVKAVFNELSSVADTVSNAFSAAVSAAKSALSPIVDFVSGIVDKVKSLLGGIGDLISGIVGIFSAVPNNSTHTAKVLMLHSEVPPVVDQEGNITYPKGYGLKANSDDDWTRISGSMRGGSRRLSQLNTIVDDRKRGSGMELNIENYVQATSTPQEVANELMWQARTSLIGV